MADTTSRLQQNLADARRDLADAQTNLGLCRSKSLDSDSLRYAEQNVYHALDRVWDLQCMVGGSL